MSIRGAGDPRETNNSQVGTIARRCHRVSEMGEGYEIVKEKKRRNT